MDPVYLTIGTGLVSAILYLYRRMERSEDRCIAENLSLRQRMDDLEKRHAAERAEVLGGLTNAIRDLSASVRRPMPHDAPPIAISALEPLPHDDPNGTI